MAYIIRRTRLRSHLQRGIATWVNRRDRGKIGAEEFHAGIEAVRAEWTKATQGKVAC